MSIGRKGSRRNLSCGLATNPVLFEERSEFETNGGNVCCYYILVAAPTNYHVIDFKEQGVRHEMHSLLHRSHDPKA